MTSRFTPARLAAAITRFVPSTAGSIRSSSFFGSAKTNGLATCKTNVQPCIALSQPLSDNRSASAKSSFFIETTLASEAFVDIALFSERTVPTTE